MTRVAINGFGRIGRTVARILSTRGDIEWVAVNDLAPVDTMVHLFRYDSVHGRFTGEAVVEGADMRINGKKVRYLSEKDPSGLPWQSLGVDVVLDCTGIFKKSEDLRKHLNAGAKKVILSAPPASDDIKTIVIGVNHHLLQPDDHIVSNASCTTNSVAPMIRIIDDLCGIKSGYITTVHSYTGDQRLHDAPHRDLRRARAAALSIVPTTTGAAKAVTKIFPGLEGHFGGCGIRVPVPDGSLTDLTCVVENPKSIEELNRAFESAAGGNMKGIIEYTSDPLVSIDIVNNPHSCIFDAQLTSVIGSMIKVVGWYDNESGYSNRLVDLIGLLA